MKMTSASPETQTPRGRRALTRAGLALAVSASLALGPLASGSTVAASAADPTIAADVSSSYRTPSATSDPEPANGSALDEDPPSATGDPDTGSVELGMRFSPKVDGSIIALRFFKTSDSSGPHRGILWDAGGNVLAEVPFAETSAQGWQLAELSSPIAVAAGEDYVVSYLAPTGRYAAAQHFFDMGIDSHYLSVPPGAGVYAYGSGGFPTENYQNSNYYVDVVFAPGGASPPPPASGGSVLELPRDSWWGGPRYYRDFAKADAAGWDADSFFPIAVFFGKPEHAASLAAIGVNTYMGAEHDGSPMSSITDEGISVLAQGEWTPAEVGDDTGVVGWHVSDECEMGHSGCTETSESGRLATQQRMVSAYRSRDDGRFLQANFGNGVLGTYWAPNTMDDHLALMDVTSVDKYAYTSPHVQDLLRNAPTWPLGVDPASAAAYGWQQTQMESFMPVSAPKPNWVFIETARPFLSDVGARTITVPQIEGAVWSAIINGAAGIAYFQHNSDPACGTYSLIDCSPSLREGVKRINEDVTALAPVINSPSYEWVFGDGLRTALKAHEGHAYIFAMTDGGTGERSFTLPPGVSGTIEVVGEGRMIEAVDGRFMDDFDAEYSHRIYRTSLD